MDLQEFSYNFINGSKIDKILLCTFAARSEPEKELKEIQSIYGNEEVVFQMYGGFPPIVSVTQAIEIQRTYREQNSLFKGAQRITWKIYHTCDKDSESVFIGFMSSAYDRNRFVLEPHIVLRKEYQRQGYGTKILLCLLSKLFSHKRWFYKNVKRVELKIHPQNYPALKLKKRLLRGKDKEQPNPERKDGIWISRCMSWVDKKPRPQYVRHFLIKESQSLESLLNMSVERQENTSNLILLNNRTKNKTKKRKKRIYTPKEQEEIVSSLQDFAYEFDHEEKLTFRTYKLPGSKTELDEIRELYGNDKNTSIYCGSSALVKTIQEADKFREAYRAQRSLLQGRKTIRWKMFWGIGSNEVFIGNIGIRIHKEKSIDMLEPFIMLKPEYRKKRFGTRAFLCITAKLLSLKAWLCTICEGLYIGILPHNSSSMALKDKLLQQTVSEMENPNHPQGLWLEDFFWPIINKTTTAYWRHYMIPTTEGAFSTLESLMLQKVNKTDFMISENRAGGVGEQVKLSLFELPPRIGVKQVHLYKADTKKLASELLWYRIRSSANVQRPVANTFKVFLPDDTSLESSCRFFLLFFLGGMEFQPKEFEVSKFDRTRGRIQLDFIAFSRSTSQEKHFLIRMVDECIETVVGYLLELDLNIFDDVECETLSLWNFVRGIWTTGDFSYYKLKRKRGHHDYESEVVFSRAQFSSN